MTNDDRPTTTLHCLCLSAAGAATLRGVVADNHLQDEIGAPELHRQPVFLPELLQDPNIHVAIFLADPIARYVADFYLWMESADDVPLPRGVEIPVNSVEFKTPNDLAEALSASSRETQDRAYVAMKAVALSSVRYADYLVGVDYLASRRRRIVFVGSLETYSEDMRHFFKGLGVEREIDVPDESAELRGGDHELSPLGLRNLQDWYAADVAIFTWASALRERSLAAMPRNDDAGVRDLYVDRPFVEAYRDHMNLRIRSDPHAAIGGNWEEMGRLQLDFLVARGLAPHHRFLDIGCGTLRGGRHFIRLLEPGNYVGFDLSDEAIAYAQQLVIDEELGDRQPTLFVTSGDLTFAELAGQRFDFLLAQSVFTHLPPTAIEECIAHIGEVLSDTGRLFFTYADGPVLKQKRLKGFRYPLSFFQDLADRNGLVLHDWYASYPHSRGQRMVELSRP